MLRFIAPVSCADNVFRLSDDDASPVFIDPLYRESTTGLYTAIVESLNSRPKIDQPYPECSCELFEQFANRIATQPPNVFIHTLRTISHMIAKSSALLRVTASSVLLDPIVNLIITASAIPINDPFMSMEWVDVLETLHCLLYANPLKEKNIERALLSLRDRQNGLCEIFINIVLLDIDYVKSDVTLLNEDIKRWNDDIAKYSNTNTKTFSYSNIFESIKERVTEFNNFVYLKWLDEFVHFALVNPNDTTLHFSLTNWMELDDLFKKFIHEELPLLALNIWLKEKCSKSVKLFFATLCYATCDVVWECIAKINMALSLADDDDNENWFAITFHLLLDNLRDDCILHPSFFSHVFDIAVSRRANEESLDEWIEHVVSQIGYSNMPYQVARAWVRNTTLSRVDELWSKLKIYFKNHELGAMLHAVRFRLKMKIIPIIKDLRDSDPRAALEYFNRVPYRYRTHKHAWYIKDIQSRICRS